MLNDIRFSGIENPGRKAPPCTDAANSVVFEIEKAHEA
jgi:hypothetical protein